jgi:hypothetical protein
VPAQRQQRALRGPWPWSQSFSRRVETARRGSLRCEGVEQADPVVCVSQGMTAVTRGLCQSTVRHERTGAAELSKTKLREVVANESYVSGGGGDRGLADRRAAE